VHGAAPRNAVRSECLGAFGSDGLVGGEEAVETASHRRRPSRQMRRRPSSRTACSRSRCRRPRKSGRPMWRFRSP